MEILKLMSFTLIKVGLFGFKGKKQIELIKDAVCYNQGELAQYSYLAGEKHKAMKDELKQSSPDADKVRRLKEDLEGHLNGELKKVVMENFRWIKKYFQERAKREPRVCIKGNEDGKIVDLFREEKNHLYSKDSSAEDNMGFHHVKETGKYYLCNDIPREVKAERYYNPRLNLHVARKYKRSLIANFISWMLGTVDEKWVDCWERIQLGAKQVAPRAEQCYKSTLITPMTLLGNTLSREFMEQFRIQTMPERAIYGFLCLDHHTNYFKNDLDVWISYIFADILSLYLIIGLTYTEYSRTFESADDLLRE